MILWIILIGGVGAVLLAFLAMQGPSASKALKRRMELVKRAHDIYTRAGQSPVLLKKEITGFLLNRIQGAVLNEALNLYENGYASSEDLDKVLKDGLGLRWSFMGPFETIDLNAPEGVIDYAKRYGHTYRDVAKTQLPNEWERSIAI